MAIVKLLLNRKELEVSLACAQTISKSFMAKIANSVILEADKETKTVRVIATNGFIFFENTIDSEAEESIKVELALDTALPVLQTLTKPEIEIRIDTQNLITYIIGESEYALNPVEETINILDSNFELKNFITTVPSHFVYEELLTASKFCLYDHSEISPLSGVRILFGPKTTVYATTGEIMYKKTYNWVISENEVAIALHHKAIRSVSNILKLLEGLKTGSVEPLEVFIDENSFIVKFLNSTFNVPLLSGVYPNCEAYIESLNSGVSVFQTCINADSITQAVKYIDVIEDSTIHRVRIYGKKSANELVFTISNIMGKAKTTVPTLSPLDEDLKITFNRRLLSNICGIYNGNDIIFNIIKTENGVELAKITSVDSENPLAVLASMIDKNA